MRVRHKCADCGPRKATGLFFGVEEERRSIWREYVKVTTDTGLLCLLYRDLHAGGWFLARVYD